MYILADPNKDLHVVSTDPATFFVLTHLDRKINVRYLLRDRHQLANDSSRLPLKSYLTGAFK